MIPACRLRPVREEDLAMLVDLVSRISGGMTSLPANEKYLAHRINDSLRAFDHRISKPAGETYLFVLEEMPSGKIIGTSGLLSRVGGFDPFYTYRITRHEQVYAPLEVQNELKTLDLVKNHKGPTEICSLFLHPEHRRHGFGRLLSLARFSFIKAFPSRFAGEIIAELRGYLDEAGYSPFWEAVGNKFFQWDYYTADVLSGIGEKDFIEALLPEFPIYVDLLPISAQKCIGKVHTQTEPALKILLREGFASTDEVDIFDAGPIVRADREQLHTWNALLRARIQAVPSLPDKAQVYLITNRSLEYRATVAPVASVTGDILTVSPETMALLEAAEGEEVHYMPI